jgi:allantoinase
MRGDERVLRSSRVVLPDGIRPAGIVVCNGAIAQISPPQDLASEHTFDYGDLIIMPGIVDTHVHINEPGRTEWEGFETATMSAAAGGVTTIIEMPLNSIPSTITRKALEMKTAAAQGKLYVDVGFWGGVIPGNAEELAKMHAEGIFGFKCFLVPSGVPEFEAVSESVLRSVLPELALLGVPLLVHAELPELIDRATLATKEKDPKVYSTWLQSRPKEAEDQAVELLIQLADEYKVKIHIVHLSSASANPKIREAKQRGVSITVETCPHYLTIAAEDVPDGATAFKCAPPIRELVNQQELWAALQENVIDLIASDHSTVPPEMKCCNTGDFMRAWGGIASLQLALPLLWTGARRRGMGIENVANWLCRGPAKLAVLSRKGEIRAGCDADFVIWNPEESFEVRYERLLFRHKLTPYSGRRLCGVVHSTFLRGEQIYSDGKVIGKPQGRVLRRGQA